MTPIEIVLIIIGILIIVISCRLVDHSKLEGDTGNTLKLNASLSEQDEQYMRDRINKILEEMKEEAISHVDDSLSLISNEKIMAVNDFSDQILEKIKRNHEEVVFLYNMLNDKEKDLKSALREIDTSKQKLVDIFEAKKQEEKTPTAGKTSHKSQTMSAATKNSRLAPQENMSQYNNNEKATVSSINSNNNSQILGLYSQGKTIMEISKLLGLGQGEVKLVIDLFKGKK